MTGRDVSDLGLLSGDLSLRRYGSARRLLSELSDEELKDELLTRRARRATVATKGQEQEARGVAAVSADRLAAYFANLGLRKDAGLSEVRAAYASLSARYDPSKFQGDPERQRTAQELTRGLRGAYEALLQFFDAGRR